MFENIKMFVALVFDARVSIMHLVHVSKASWGKTTSPWISRGVGGGGSKEPLDAKDVVIYFGMEDPSSCGPPSSVLSSLIHAYCMLLETPPCVLSLGVAPHTKVYICTLEEDAIKIHI